MRRGKRERLLKGIRQGSLQQVAKRIPRKTSLGTSSVLTKLVKSGRFWQGESSLLRAVEDVLINT